jgi:hypothetical protein
MTSKLGTQALGKNEWLACVRWWNPMFHDIHDSGYWQLWHSTGFRLNFIKTWVVLDVEKGLIQIKQGPRNNLQILPFKHGKHVTTCQGESRD